MLTLYQARELAITKYGKSPAMATLKAACQDGRLKASQLPLGANKHVWTVLEADLEVYLQDWQPGRGAPVGNQRRKGKKNEQALHDTANS